MSEYEIEIVIAAETITEEHLKFLDYIFPGLQKIHESHFYSIYGCTLPLSLEHATIYCMLEQKYSSIYITHYFNKVEPLPPPLFPSTL